MKKSLLLVFLFIAVFYKFSYSQAPIAASNSISIHDKITNLINLSGNIHVPDSVIVILKDYAFTTNRNEAMVLKHQIYYTVLYNENISIAERIYACKFFIENNKPYEPTPAFLLNKILVSLQAKNR